MNKKTLVLGASTNPQRYSNIAVNRLRSKGQEVVAFGNKEGDINGQVIETQQAPFKDIHTITMYLSPARQAQYYDYIFSLNPQRIIFNPGSENAELMQLAKDKGIEIAVACTLVLLSTDQY